MSPLDLTAIAKKLGWATADIEGRKAIAWVIARVVIGGRIIDEDTNSRPAEGITSMPSAREEKGGVVLDYWMVPDGVRTATFGHDRVTFAANGKVTIEVLDAQTVESP